MSNEKTLFSDGNWSFYTKDDDYNFVYLSFYLGYNDVPAGKNIAIDVPVEIRIPVDAWRKIITYWQSTEWGKNKNIDPTSKTMGAVIKEIIGGKNKD